MHSKRLTWFAAIALATLVGCSGNDGGSGPTNPPPPTGPTFDFTFPNNGTSHAFTFADAGVWNYRCRPHQGLGMTGTVTVNASSANDSVVVNVGQGGTIFNPSAVTIKVGGRVRWINVSVATNHTVTRP